MLTALSTESNIIITYHFIQKWDLKPAVQQTHSGDERCTTEKIAAVDQRGV